MTTATTEQVEHLREALEDAKQRLREAAELVAEASNVVAEALPETPEGVPEDVSDAVHSVVERVSLTWLGLTAPNTEALARTVLEAVKHAAMAAAAERGDREPAGAEPVHAWLYL